MNSIAKEMSLKFEGNEAKILIEYIDRTKRNLKDLRDGIWKFWLNTMQI